MTTEKPTTERLTPEAIERGGVKMITREKLEKAVKLLVQLEAFTGVKWSPEFDEKSGLGLTYTIVRRLSDGTTTYEPLPKMIAELVMEKIPFTETAEDRPVRTISARLVEGRRVPPEESVQEARKILGTLRTHPGKAA